MGYSSDKARNSGFRAWPGLAFRLDGFSRGLWAKGVGCTIHLIWAPGPDYLDFLADAEGILQSREVCLGCKQVVQRCMLPQSVT